jgi:GntR family transcriptional regulator / MocR family aminotransferase
LVSLRLPETAADGGRAIPAEPGIPEGIAETVQARLAYSSPQAHESLLRAQRAVLASADHNGVVVYIATFTKLLASGVRLGYVAGPKPLIARMTALRALVDRQGDAVLEAAVAELLDDGELQGHVRKVRQEYLRRRDALADAGKKHGVYFAPGSTYTLNEICPAAVRLGFASMTPEELTEGVRRLAQALGDRG